LVKPHCDVCNDVNDDYATHYDGDSNAGYYDADNNCCGGSACNSYDRDNDEMGDCGSFQNGGSQTLSLTV
jgi:hypothetical protein